MKIRKTLAFLTSFAACASVLSSAVNVYAAEADVSIIEETEKTAENSTRKQYYNLLLELLNSKTSQLFDGCPIDASNATFAVADLDNDGEEELFVTGFMSQFTCSRVYKLSSSGMQQITFGCPSEEYVTFYDNGIAEAYSGNSYSDKGSLGYYKSENGMYKCKESVGILERGIFGDDKFTDYSGNDVSYADKNNNGLIYGIENRTATTLDYTWVDDDAEEFVNLRNKYISGANVISIGDKIQKLNAENIQALIKDEEEPELSGEEKLKNEIADAGSIYRWEYHDYDGDGISEAYAVVKPDADKDEYAVYYVSGNGEVVTMLDSFPYVYASSDDENLGKYTVVENQGFFSCDSSAGGSGYSTYLFSVKDNNPYELAVSGSLQGFFWDKDLNSYATTKNDFSAGYHQYPVVKLNYSNGEFTMGDTVIAKEAAREIYANVIETIKRDHTFLQRKFVPERNESETGSFAIADIDGDGKEELIVVWNVAYTAAYTEVIYGIDDNGEVYEEAVVYPTSSVYSDNLLVEYISHNQGPSHIWPYTVHKYNSETGKYEKITQMVFGWDKSMPSSETFPEDADKDGNGKVYKFDGINWVDDAEYDEWRKTIFGDAKDLKISYKEMTDANIKNIKTDNYISEQPVIDNKGLEAELQEIFNSYVKAKQALSTSGSPVGGIEKFEFDAVNNAAYGIYGWEGSLHPAILCKITKDGVIELTDVGISDTSEDKLWSKYSMTEFTSNGVQFVAVLGNLYTNGGVRYAATVYTVSDGKLVCTNLNAIGVGEVNIQYGREENDPTSSRDVNDYISVKDDIATINGVNYIWDKEKFVKFGDSESTYNLGDVNTDGAINASDASLILLIYAKLSTSGEITQSPEQLIAADVDKDGSVSATDASMVLSYYAYLSTLSNGQPVSIEDFIKNRKA